VKNLFSQENQISVLSDFQQYEVAINAFKLEFGQLLGEINMAQDYLATYLMVTMMEFLLRKFLHTGMNQLNFGII